MADRERVMERIAGWTVQDTDIGERSAPSRTIQIFISHAAEDQHLVASLIEFLRESVDIEPWEIRCTSVPGYSLPISSHIPTVLRQELERCAIVLGVITLTSLGSSWVMIELGAGWMKEKAWIILDRDIGFDRIPGPLREHHALRLSEKRDLMQLADDVARRLGRRKRGGEYAAETFLDARDHQPR